MEQMTEFFKSANWAFLKGNFTPKELRELADEIEKRYKEFSEKQEG